MKLLLCAATPKELKVVKEEIKKLQLKLSLPIVYLCTGIGNHQTIFNLTTFLSEHKEEQYFIVNIGVCGYSSVCKGVIQVSVVEHLHIKKEAIIPIFLHLAPLGKMISSEIPVDDEKMLDFWEEEEVFVDMESWGIELVAQHFQYPRLLLKVPIDKVGNATKHFNFEEALETLRKAIDYRNLIENLLKYLPCC